MTTLHVCGPHLYYSHLPKINVIVKYYQLNVVMSLNRIVFSPAIKVLPSTNLPNAALHCLRNHANDNDVYFM